MRNVRILYFARLRERIGIEEENIDLPQSVVTIGDLLGFLKERGDEWREALSRDSEIRVALDREHVGNRSASLDGVEEIALFPPMTGG